MLSRLIALAASGAFFTLCTTSCTDTGPTGSHPSGTGPFNSRGDYVEAWADDPTKWRGGARKPTPTRTTTPTPTRPTPPVVVSTPRPTTPATRPATPTASRPAAAAPKPKPKPTPQPKRYTVKRGDTLSAIARRNSTTVAALRRANGISGDLIRPGQVLRIP